MSNQANILLLERAAEMMDYFEGKLPARMIERDIQSDDLESLYAHVCEAEGIASQQETEASDVS